MTYYKNNFRRKIIRECLIISILLFLFPIISLAKEARSIPQLTSSEAANLAYQEAKQWDKEAVLWYLCPPARSLDYHWYQNELSWEWEVMFARPRDEQIYYFKLMDGQIVTREEGGEYLKRLSPILLNLPKDKTVVSMQEAAQVIFTAGAPSWERPNVVYVIDNSIEDLRGRPVWLFLFWSQVSTYAVDGISGELIRREYFDPQTLKKINPEEVKYEFYPDKKVKIKEENFIYDFFEAITQGDIEQYFSMMDRELAGNEMIQEMWKTAFSSLELIKIISLYPEEERKWHNKQPLYRTIIYALPRAGAPYYGWDEGRNTRWISITPYGDSWKIVSITTSP